MAFSRKLNRLDSTWNFLWILKWACLYRQCVFLASCFIIFLRPTRMKVILNVAIALLEVSRIKYALNVFLLNNWKIMSYCLQFCYLFERGNGQLKLLNRRGCCQNYLTTLKLIKFVNSTTYSIKRGACLPVCMPLIHKRVTAENRRQKSIKKA